MISLWQDQIPRSSIGIMVMWNTMMVDHAIPFLKPNKKTPFTVRIWWIYSHPIRWSKHIIYSGGQTFYHLINITGTLQKKWQTRIFILLFWKRTEGWHNKPTEYAGQELRTHFNMLVSNRHQAFSCSNYVLLKILLAYMHRISLQTVKLNKARNASMQLCGKYP
jgi:hypothetical protein